MESTALREGTNKDLRDIWDALEPTGFVQVLYKGWWYVEDRVDKQNGEEAWKELEEILNDIDYDEEEEEDTYDSEEEEDEEEEEEEEEDEEEEEEEDDDEEEEEDENY